METYGFVLLFAVPFFLMLILIEYFYQWKIGEKFSPSMDSISSLSSGLTNSIKDILGLSVSIISYDYMVRNLALFHIESSVFAFIIAFLVLDFQGYWTHRFQHRINILWNNHIIHHSSEEFNLACALRQSISSFVNLFTFFLFPCALLGVETQVIATVAPLHLFAQFWYHTRYINHLGWLEKIIVTPSHHRVHHAINPVYIDKNFSQIFIFWDKIFGTFQEELDHEPPVYGISRPVRTWNPVKINFQHLFLLIKDVIRTKNIWDKFTIWFRPTGWRPADVQEKYAVDKIEDVYQYEKFNPPTETGLIIWSWTQFVFILLNTMFFFGHIAAIGIPNIFFYGFYAFISIYAYTELMDRNRNAIFWESIRFFFVVYYLFRTKSWFGIDTWIPYGNELIIGFSIISWIGSLLYSLKTPQNIYQESKKLSSLRLS
jgi:sterol desaturase/sphingolipid hydroxylase (fatty acid hydroxylase superfamily)